MRFLIMVKGNTQSETGVMPDEALMAEMATYHEELARAGCLLDAAGLHPTSKAIRIKFSGGRRTIVDGPFTESKELIAGYTLIQVKTREEGLEWARRFPAPFPGGEGEIEVRQLMDLEDFEPNATIDRFKELEKK